MFMKYCYACGHPLIVQWLEHEGEIPYCPHCKSYRFSIFNTAVSMIALNPLQDKILMIQQYHRKHNILVAGYVNKTESAEEALVREMKEEIGRDVIKHRYMRSEYFQSSNTLILNFAVTLDSEDLCDVSNWEVDSAKWFTFAQAKESVLANSLAQRFLLYFMERYEANPTTFF